MTEQEALGKIVREQKLEEQKDTLKVLDYLRKTRSQRGLGAPLEVPPELKLGIIITENL